MKCKHILLDFKALSNKENEEMLPLQTSTYSKNKQGGAVNETYSKKGCLKECCFMLHAFSFYNLKRYNEMQQFPH